MKLIRTIALILSLVVLLSFTISITGCDDGGGDGITSCKNCGRTPVYALGFCKTCYKGFANYTYGKK